VADLDYLRVRKHPPEKLLDDLHVGRSIESAVLAVRLVERREAAPRSDHHHLA
jgi:hypothetical protein